MTFSVWFGVFALPQVESGLQALSANLRPVFTGSGGTMEDLDPASGGAADLLVTSGGGEERQGGADLSCLGGTQLGRKSEGCSFA